jgi:hypothetical protein
VRVRKGVGSELRPPHAGSAGEWYWVAATYKAVHVGKTRKRHLWERTVFLVQAANEDEASRLAEQVGREKEVEYLAAGGDTVRWVFQGIERMEQLLDERFENGTEVYWEFFK